MAGHYLKTNKGTEAPSNLIFVQTHSIVDPKRSTPATMRHTLSCWSARRIRLEGSQTTRVAVASGTTADEFWQFVDRHSDAQRRTWIFGEDIAGQMKLLGFLKLLDSDYFTLKPLVRKDRFGHPTGQKSWNGKFVVDTRVTFIQCRRESRKYVIVDTNNYWPCGLETVAESLGVYCRRVEHGTADTVLYTQWCENRCEAVAAAVVSLITEWVKEQCGVFQMTAASLSFTHWRHTCNIRVPGRECVDFVCEPDAPHHKMERAAYYGGRIQPFTIGEVAGPLYHVDVNSLYPHVMREHSFPRRYIRREHGPRPERLLDSLSVYGCVAEVLIRTRNATYPIRIDGRQFHCNGCYWSTLCGPELRRALQSGVVDKVGWVQYYSVAPLFRDWVGYWYRRKLDAIRKGPAGRGELSFVKAILLSLSGKYAQKGRRWLDSPGTVAAERWGGWSELLADPGNDLGVHSRVRPTRERDDTGDTRIVRQWRGIAGHAQFLDESREPGHAFPVVSAYITAHGREYMLTLIECAGECNVHYMATDSLIVNQRGFSRLKRAGYIHPDKIGLLKVKGRHDRGEIFGANHYEMDGELTAAGWLTLTTTDPSGVEVCEVWDRGISVIASGPTDDIAVRRMPVGPYVPDLKGSLDKSGRWTPYRLSFDPEFTDKPPKPGYSRADLKRLAT